jgi:hypothetical protein
MELSKLLIALVALLMSVSAGGQTLNIVSNGQTGSSGTNWSVSGTNPVTITATGNANVNTSGTDATLTLRAEKRVTTSFAITSGTTREIINEKLIFFYNLILFIIFGRIF